MKLNKHHLLLLLFLLGATLHAQVKNITGRVIDAKERNPISFVPIVVKTSPPTEPPQVVMTDLDGKFQLQAKEGDVLEIAFMGYEKQYKKIEGKAKKKHFKIVLEEEKFHREEYPLESLSNYRYRYLIRLRSILALLSAALMGGYVFFTFGI